MIRGILALFTSGIMTNPMVLLGIILGSVLYFSLDGQQIFQVYKMPSFYGFAVVLSCIYVLVFRRIYKENGDTDWGETLLSVIASFFRFIVASILMISFISLFDMGDIEKITESGL
ncbi:MAG: hypothetical protein IJ529_05985 [Alphaproteobacteria bacterium]|nr:hypothetical protein [Alphaproteobacteria bacterium]MBQ8677999.1 hypothetical protein [Alphaproteobacteria bacterium]